MKAALSILGALVLLLVVREAFFSNNTYLFRVSGARLTVDGRLVDGWLHQANGLFIATWETGGSRQSYWIVPPGRPKGGVVTDCSPWSASRFWVVFIGDVNPPCMFAVASREPNLATASRQIEFTSNRGARVTIRW